MSLELERSGPVFDRARRLAGALFGGGAGDADIVLVQNGVVWRSSDPEGRRMPATAHGSQWVVENGEHLWIEDVSRDARYGPLAAGYGQASLRLYVATPIRLDDGAVPGVLVVGRPEAHAYDPVLAERLQDWPISSPTSGPGCGPPARATPPTAPWPRSSPRRRCRWR